MFDKEKFKQDLLDVVEPGTSPTTPHVCPVSVIFSVLFIVLLGWVMADIWAAVHHLA